LTPNQLNRLARDTLPFFKQLFDLLEGRQSFVLGKSIAGHRLPKEKEKMKLKKPASASKPGSELLHPHGIGYGQLVAASGTTGRKDLAAGL